MWLIVLSDEPGQELAEVSLERDRMKRLWVGEGSGGARGAKGIERISQEAVEVLARIRMRPLSEILQRRQAGASFRRVLGEMQVSIAAFVRAGGLQPVS